MRLLFITTGLNIGGAERALYSLVQNGLKERYVIQIVSLRNEGHYGKKLKSNGVRVYCLNLQNPLNFFMGFARLFWLSRKFKPDLIQGWMYHGNIFALLVAFFLRFKPKLFWGIRQTLYDTQKEKFFTRLVIKAGSMFSTFADSIIYNSKKSQDQHESIGFSRVNGDYIPNGFNSLLWNNNDFKKELTKRELEIPKNSLVVGYIGRYHQMKNIELLFKAVDDILKKDTNIFFLVIGKNTDIRNPELKPYYDRLPPAQVLSLGERTDIPRIIRCMDLLCLTSAWGEGFPNVIGEAMLSGVPCVVTDIGDSSLIVGETGWTVPSNNIELLTKAINSALSESACERNSRSLLARKRIEDNYDISNIVKQYHDIYSRD